MANFLKNISFVLFIIIFPVQMSAQSHTDKVRQFERLLREWKSDGYSTGSEKYTQLMSMVTDGCRMSEYVAKSYIDDNNASTFDIKAGSWFQYIKEKKISISLRDLQEKTDEDRKPIVYCWITYTRPGRSDKKDFVGFKFNGGKIFYIFNDDRERDNRIRAKKEVNVVDTKPTVPFTITSCTVSNVDCDNNPLPMDAEHSQYLTPTITYNCTTSGSYDIYVKLYDANGKLRTGSSSPSGYSYKDNVSLSSGSGSVKTFGWGSETSGHWSAGSHRFEFYYNGTLLYTHRFTVPQGQQYSGGNGSSGGHQYVDLGLPSHTLWATTNIGAKAPEDYGDYFAWGETTTTFIYKWPNYKYSKERYDKKLTKYCNMSKYGYNGYTDNRIKLEHSDDIAYQKWGSDWCIPTRAQFRELKNKCTWTWTTKNGTNGYVVKGPNGNIIFLPAAGYRNFASRSYAGSYGCYWSSSLTTGNPRKARYLHFDISDVNPDSNNDRPDGFSVRPVRNK